MHKNDRARLFQTNLQHAMNTAAVNKTQLALRADIDRSTLGQLLSENSGRLPNGHTLALLAEILGVSVDWLLGLSNESRPVTTFLDGALNFTEASQRAPVDANLEAWWKDAAGAKVRHVPTSLPDMFKIQAVLEFEYRDFSLKTGAQAITARNDQRMYVRMPETDTEVCLPSQSLEQFAAGTHLWQGLSTQVRRNQLQFMADQIDELYPTVRVYGFDMRVLYSVPFTVFGHKRAAIYLGQGYFVLNTGGHIRQMTKQFDSLVRGASIHAHHMPQTLRDLSNSI